MVPRWQWSQRGKLLKSSPEHPWMRPLDDFNSVVEVSILAWDINSGLVPVDGYAIQHRK